MGIFPLYETSECINLISALATNYAVKAIIVVELSLSRFFKRQYSSLFHAIGLDLHKKSKTEERIKARDRIKSFLFKSVIAGDNGVHSFVIGITGNIKFA